MVRPDRWAGRCDVAVVSLLLGGVNGVRKDGVWTGPVAKAWGLSGHRRWRKDAAGFPIHCWIDHRDGTVTDPTRWVFEKAWPYVYKGPPDHYADAVEPIEQAET